MAQPKCIISNCPAEFALAVNDTLEFLSGKWKLPILGSLIEGKKRFREIERTLPGISPRMLSKELRDLEMNKMVTRTVYDTIPATVEYEITEYGLSLDKVLMAMYEWGTAHRKKIMGKTKKAAQHEPVTG
ncbi:winged helix-turn-helix transcriptional regulator [Flavihumibacter fluvii]|uniref:winged helix-turn-helix transcriptional regulator n=1 Tax=Flavihumibacter fluvii TaxID=2838157 RepID=UPI001BDE561C|nr:helix-turn-helix domain-containing protein [Flavihumibacter fluvii]ULQ52070.1 helix-turn-helix transcriptional regulator [Flavihumibacter fluvii]